MSSETQIEKQPHVEAEINPQENGGGAPTPTSEETPAPEVTPEPAPADPTPNPTPASPANDGGEVTPPKQTTDYKKAYGESTRQNQVIMNENSHLRSTIEDLTKVELPTDDEMVAKYGQEAWSGMNEVNRDIARQTELNTRRQNKIEIERREEIASRTRSGAIDTAISGNAELVDRADEFRQWANHPSRLNSPVTDDFVKAFLWDNRKDDTPAPTDETPAPQERHVLENGGSSGGQSASTSTEQSGRSAEELKAMRKSDPKAYNEAIRKGQI